MWHTRSFHRNCDYVKCEFSNCSVSSINFVFISIISCVLVGIRLLRAGVPYGHFHHPVRVRQIIRRQFSSLFFSANTHDEVRKSRCNQRREPRKRGVDERRKLYKQSTETRAGLQNYKYNNIMRRCSVRGLCTT